MFESGAVPIGALAVRAGAIAGVLGVAVGMDLSGARPLSGAQIQALYGVASAGLVAAFVISLLRARTHKRSLLGLELAADFLLALSLVYCTGGANSPFAFVFVVWIVYASTRAGPRGAAASALLSTAALGLISFEPSPGWLTSLRSADAVSDGERVQLFAMYSAAFVAVALLAHRLAREVSSGRSKLRELGEIHRSIVDSVSSGLMTVDTSGRITSFNPEAERITGFRYSEICGRQAVDTFPSLAEVIREARDERADTAPSRLEISLSDRSGEARQLGLSCAALRDDDGTDAGSVLIFQDLTGVLKMQDELRRSERLAAVGQLAAGLAHEIRNPLASLWGSIELLGDELQGLGPEQRQLLGIVERETARLNDLLEDFLSYARPGTARREVVALGELLGEIRELASKTGEPPTRVELDLEPELRVSGDPTQLRSVFWNLVLNAIQSEPKDGVIRMRCASEPASEDHPASVVVEIADRGHGIPPELVERIFEPFFTTRPRGSGLGLATVHRLIELHAGSLALESQPGEGTRVRVCLPVDSD